MKLDKIARYRRWITVSAVAITVVAGIYFFVTYGSWEVLAGMDTMTPGYPPGATCIIEKNPKRVKAKQSVVILEVPGGAALLSRVERIEGDKIYIRHDNRQSGFLDFEKRSYSIADIRGLVLTVLIPDPEPGLVPEPTPGRRSDGKPKVDRGK